MEQQNQINQQMMHNLVQLQNQMQQVSSVVRKEGEELMNKGIPDRYHHSVYNDVNKMGLRSHYRLGENHNGNDEPKIRHDVHPRRNPKRKCDGSAVHGIRKIKPSTFD